MSLPTKPLPPAASKTQQLFIPVGYANASQPATLVYGDPPAEPKGWWPPLTTPAEKAHLVNTLFPSATSASSTLEFQKVDGPPNTNLCTSLVFPFSIHNQMVTAPHVTHSPGHSDLYCRSVQVTSNMSSSNKESISTYLSGIDAFYRDDPDTTTWCTEEEWNELPAVVIPRPPSCSPTVVVARPAPWQAALWAQLDLDPETPWNNEALAPPSDKVDGLPVPMLVGPPAMGKSLALEQISAMFLPDETSDDIMAGTTEKLQWQALHIWWRDFRARKKVTFARLFEMGGESENPSYYEYLTPSGIHKNVSTKPGSLGARVIALLNKAKSIDETTISFPPLTSRELVRDVAEDARLILVMKGIFIVDLVTIDISDGIDHDFIEVDVLESATPPVKAEDVLALIREYALEPNLDPTLQVVINPTQYLNQSE